MSILLAAVAAVLFGVGTYLVLQRQLSRIVIGVGLLGHGVNVLLVVASRGRGKPPFVGADDHVIADHGLGGVAPTLDRRGNG